MSQRSRAVLLAIVLGMGAVGCELVADFDRSLIDAGPIPVQDSGPVDGAPGADASKDTNQPDTTVHDTGPDTNLPDTNQDDTNQPDVTEDTNQPDTNQADTNQPDVRDAGHDTNQPDTNQPDTNQPDTNQPDTNQPDTNLPDTNLPDTNLPDTNPSACNALDPAPAPEVTVADSANAAPVLVGGTFPTSGTWYMTDMTFYLPDGGSSGLAGTKLKQILTITGTALESALLPTGGTLQTESDTVAAAATTATITKTCPSAGVTTPSFEVDVDGGVTTLMIQNGDQVITYTML